MARQPRLVVPGFPMHVVQRGNNRTACFKSGEDFLVYLALLREEMPAARCALHAYCLMPNHVHLLLTPSAEESCGTLMRQVSFRYSQFFNKKHRRTGTLWEGRYRSCLVESRTYVLACHRYVDPVRAGMVETASDYPWSSFRANAGALTDPLLTRHEELTAISPADYVKMVSDSLAPDILKALRDSTAGGYPFASEAFKASLAQSATRRLDRSRPGPKGRSATATAAADLLG